MNGRWLLKFVTVAIAAWFATPSAYAQIDVYWLPEGEDAWEVDENWQSAIGNFIPDAAFDDTAIIDNGGTAVVDAGVTSPAGVEVGPGTVVIRAGGNLTVIDGFLGTTNGHVIVGQGAAGTLRVVDGGTLVAEAIQSNSNGSLIAASGSSVVTSNGIATLNGTTRISGPDVVFSVADDLVLGGTYAPEITSTTHSALSAGGTARLSGSLQVEFRGVTPSAGDAWDLVDASRILGRFSSVELVGDKMPGQRMRVEVVPGGANGTIARAAVDNALVLSIDRDTGAATISNPAGGPDIRIDGYSILSPSGALNIAAWNSLTDQGMPDWREAASGATSLNELKAVGGSDITASDTLSLGNVYSPAPSEFGVEIADAVLEYTGPSGETVIGDVVYTGATFNNLVLQVDPKTGESELRNTSPFDVEIEGYSILSASGALDTTGWNSLHDQGIATWIEAAPQADGLSELLAVGTEAMPSGRSIHLGSLFDTAGSHDLTFEFLLAGDAEPTSGVVVFEELLTPIVNGDYNGNGRVEQADLDLVLLNWGDPFGTLPTEWINERPISGIVDQAELDGVLLNWGSTAAGGRGSGPVPEPASGVILLSAILCTFLTYRQC